MASASLPLRLLCTIYIGISIVFQWVLGWLSQVIYMAFAYPFTTKDQRQDACGRIFRFASHLGMDVLNPFWTVQVNNKFPETKHKRIILIMNHLSDADPFISIRTFLPRDGTFIAKDELFRVPFGGWAMANAGDLAVRFRNKKLDGFATVKGTIGPMMEQAAEKLRRGRMLCVYPEGTRSNNPDGPLLPFRHGFFKLAMDEDAIIVPLACSGSEKMWPRGSAMMDRATAYFTFGEPVEAKDFKSVEELSQHVWQVMTDIRESHPDRVALHNKKSD